MIILIVIIEDSKLKYFKTFLVKVTNTVCSNKTYISSLNNNNNNNNNKLSCKKIQFLILIKKMK
jgi:hypothetical protein